MHTYAILTVTSADYVNILIRDGLLVCGARVRPTKQKLEPIQCMKCRNWGHFAGECLASADTCGTCRGKHCTNACQNRDKCWCVTCESDDHASWDRNCPEFSRRCYSTCWMKETQKTTCCTSPQSRTGPKHYNQTGSHLMSISQEGTQSTVSPSTEQGNPIWGHGN